VFFALSTMMLYSSLVVWLCGLMTLLLLLIAPSDAFSIIHMSSSSSSTNKNRKLIYGIPNSGWSSPEWNWGSPVGTGHDCAAICRQTYGTPQTRQRLIQKLLQAHTEVDFEEVKLILGLAWQRGHWDGSDGAPGGYEEVLEWMAEAERYEEGSEEACAKRLVKDMQERFFLLHPTPEQQEAMDALLPLSKKDPDAARRKAAGLVLQAMGFVEHGL
jgi:hypothetical protein